MRVRYLLFLMLLVVISSCTKDDDVIGTTATLKADSAKRFVSVSSPASRLALSGTLTFKIKDSTYTFNAANDSVALVNVFLDNKKYYGLTAINKAHTMSFGISSPGYAAAKITDTIAGSQFLLNNAGQSGLEYTLSRSTALPDMGKLIITQYAQDSVLARGTFVTYLSNDGLSTSPFYKVTGSFNLKIK